MNLIVNVDENWGIGRGNNLLFRISADMKFFRSKTIGKVVIMGRKTLMTMPNEKPLKGRENIILSKNRGLEVEGAKVCASLEELLSEARKYKSEDVFVIGGQAVYNLLLDYCDTAFVTKTQARGDAEKYFPNLDENNEWILAQSSDVFEENGVRFNFNTYKRTNKQ
jgi:dihydrofolate reductase